MALYRFTDCWHEFECIMMQREHAPRCDWTFRHTRAMQHREYMYMVYRVSGDATRRSLHYDTKKKVRTIIDKLVSTVSLIPPAPVHTVSVQRHAVKALVAQVHHDSVARLRLKIQSRPIGPHNQMVA